MADQSLVARAYAEVRADLSKLPADLIKVPSLVKRMLSTSGINNALDIFHGNISGGLANIAKSGYQAQADKLRELSEAAKEASKRLAGVNDKAGAQRASAAAAKYANQAKTVDAMGENMGARVALAARIGIIAIGAVAAVAATYFATTVAAAHQASEKLKTAQLVRATGEAAGWSAIQLEHMGEQLRKNSQFSAAQVSGGQQALLKNPNVQGDQYKKALQTAANLAAVFGKELPEAAAELGNILGSLNDTKLVNGEMLKDYGVYLTQAEQGTLKNKIATRDWVGAQEMLLEKLSKFDGAAKEASQVGAGGFEKLKNAALAAAVQIGGLDGDVGKTAARIADMIDSFMGLTVVKDTLDLLTFNFRTLNSIISYLVDGSADDFTKWGDQISEIYHNVRDEILAGWEMVKQTAREMLAYLGINFNGTFTSIRNFVTDTLDRISLLTTSFALTAILVWKRIQLGAYTAWDGIRDGLAALVVMFEASWAAIGKGASVAWEQIKNTFSDKSSTRSIGDEMSKAFEDSLRAGVGRYNLGDSPEAKKLKSEIAQIEKEMNDQRDKVRKKREDDAKAKDAADKALEKPGKGAGPVNTKPYKFEFVGFEEMYKNIQQALYPSKIEQMQKAGLDAAQKAVENGVAAIGLLGEIRDSVKDGIGLA